MLNLMIETKIMIEFVKFIYNYNFTNMVLYSIIIGITAIIGIMIYECIAQTSMIIDSRFTKLIQENKELTEKNNQLVIELNKLADKNARLMKIVN